MSNAYQMVTCSACGKHYRCTPAQDYYNATNTEDGVCETCLLTHAGIHPDNVVTLPSAAAVRAPYFKPAA